jgi:hypothetical protein
MLSYLKPLQQLANRSWVAYLALALLQFKVMWRVWDYKDLATGDTSSYFLTAYTWAKDWVSDIVWSPLYTTLYGTFLEISSDVYAATILHRLAIVFTATLLVLAVLRRLLPHGIAWVIAAWWAVLPINFDTLYEVHLFAIIPTLAACLLILSKPAPWKRGGAIAIIAAATILVRNELSLATAFMGAVCIVWEIWQYRTVQKLPMRTYFLSYGIPILAAVSLVIFFYAHSRVKFPELSVYAAPKHTLNICQVYAFGYQQRYSDWVGSPWTECHSLMKRQFGQELPTLLQALRANPPAMLEHFRWNFSLALNGIQVSLFNATSGSVNPDYAPVQLNAAWIIVPTLLTGMVSITGLVILYRDRLYWWRFWLKERMLGWMLLLSVATVGFFVVIPMQRPRPSYLFGLTIFLMALVGMSLFVIAQRWQKLQKVAPLLPILMVALLVGVPNYYIQHPSERRLLGFYRMFAPYQEIIGRSDTVFLTREFTSELCSFLRRAGNCQPVSYNAKFFSRMPANMPLETFLGNQGVNLFYADENLLAEFKGDRRTENLLTKPETIGWQLLSSQNAQTYNGMLFDRLNDSPYSFADDLKNNRFKSSGIYVDGWVSKKSSFELVQIENPSKLRVSGIIPVTSNPNFTSQLQIKIDQQEVFNQALVAGSFNFEIEVPDKVGLRSVRLRFSKAQSLPAPDKRRIAAKLTFIGFNENG